ncbi:group II intron reverse transcriptase/maturase [Pedobacter sp. HMWF019]|uniref:group II intron reverse transcriptase/maturase n=1 Tax=Pedobacter sp. HMWF019 TaxID=2056856 RepID=UPI0018EEC1D2|nr:group II intron reverse transcriptase/maturase [Pedobacter sp. HMWF019]
MRYNWKEIKRMIDYYETKAHPITKRMVLDGYKQIRANGRAAGVDGVSLDEFAKDLKGNLYKLWNRMTSGSYYPKSLREKKIDKGGGKFRSLGIPCVEDRIAQSVMKTYLEPLAEPTFHEDSYGYRPKRHAHQAIKKAYLRGYRRCWILDIDIRSFFDTIDHELMMKAVKRYTQEKWVLMYIERWLKGGMLMEDGTMIKKEEGSGQGSVISPLLSNIYLHFVFDKWMQKNYPDIMFERYCDDIIVHCDYKRRAIQLKRTIAERFEGCKLEMNVDKTQIVYCKRPGNKGRIVHEKSSFDFLGYTFKPRLWATPYGMAVLTMPTMSTKAKKRIAKEIRDWKLHFTTGTIQRLARIINPKTRGWINYYCEFGKWGTTGLWRDLNFKLTRWVMGQKGIGFRRAHKWLKRVYAVQPNLFAHWGIVHP